MTKNISIKGLLIFSGAVMVLLLSVLIGINNHYLNSTQQKMDIQVADTNANLTIKDIRYHVIQIQQFLTDVSATSDRGGFDEAQRNADNAYQKTAELLKIMPDSRKELNSIKSQIEKLHTIGKEMANAYIEKGQEQGNLIMKRPQTGFDDTSAALAEQLDVFSDRLSNQLFNRIEEAHSSIDVSQRLVTWLTIAVLSITGLLMVLFYRRVIPPLMALESSMLDIAEGSRDLTIKIPVNGNCEIGHVAASFNKFVGNIRELVAEISNTSSNLAQKGDRMSRVSEESLRRMQNLKGESEQVASAMEEMKTSVQNVVSNANKVSDKAIESENEALTGHELVKRTITSIESLANKVESAAQTMHRLETDIGNIDSIVDVINSISAQTNLLALNAAIEAARAGEQGRGFAVVADEVRVLAQRTQESTSEIQGKINQLQNAAREATLVMQQGQEESLINVQNAQTAGVSLDKITQAVSIIKDMISEISLATKSQAEMTQNIYGNISTITAESDSTAENARQTEQATSEMAELLLTLNHELSSFKIGQFASLDLSKAKTAHLAWKSRLRSFLDGESTLTSEQAVSHHHCDFGKWYYSEGLAVYSHIDELKQIEKPHAKLHQLIKEIVQFKIDGDTQKAERTYLEIEPISNNIVDLLNKVESRAKLTMK